MFKTLKEVSGPSIFTLGLTKYKQNKFENSKKMILRAGKWMPQLKSDALYIAALLLVESKLGFKFEIKKYQNALESLKGSRYKDAYDYSVIVEDLRKIIDAHGTEPYASGG